jgi:hypothetical protein
VRREGFRLSREGGFLVLWLWGLLTVSQAAAIEDIWRLEVRPGPTWSGLVLEDALRQPYDIGRATQRRLTLVAVLRGHWDPYSNQLLKELRNGEQQILDKGFQIIAITPDNPYRMRGTLDRFDLPFVLCSDPGLKVAGSLGLVRAMTAEKEKALAEAGIRFRESETEPAPRVAGPALVILGEDGKIYLQMPGIIETVRFSLVDLVRICGEARSKSVARSPN